MLEPDQLHTILDMAPPPLKAMILLGLNGGLGNFDCASLPSSAVNLETGWLDYPRPKTGIGRRVPLVGRVSMDSVCVDATDAGEVGMDEPFVLLGGQGDERITPVELARLRDSIPNEVFCAFGPRLERRTVGVDGGASA